MTHRSRSFSVTALLAVSIVIATAGAPSSTAHASPTVTTIVKIPGPPRAVRPHPWYYPLLKLSPRVYERFEQCVLPGQSRSTFAHPNTGDNSKYGSSGVFQMEPVLWNRWAPVAGVHVVIWKATLYQQALVAATVYKHDGFTPWKGC